MSTSISRLWLLSALASFASGTASINFTAISPGQGLSSNGIPTSIFNPQTVDFEQFTWTNNTEVTIRNVCLGNNQTQKIIAESTPLEYGGDLGFQLQSKCYMVSYPKGIINGLNMDILCSKSVDERAFDHHW